jgi:hypothetical protein
VACVASREQTILFSLFILAPLLYSLNGDKFHVIHAFHFPMHTLVDFTISRQMLCLCTVSEA